MGKMDPEFWDEQNFIKSRDKEIAEQVATNRTKNQKQVYTLHGEKSETKKSLDFYSDGFEKDNELCIQAETDIVIDGVMDRSYCLDGLHKNKITFNHKIKHVMVRNCNQTEIVLNNGTIAGIDILYGSNVSIKTPKHNYTNVEQSNLTRLGGAVDDDSLIHVTKSMDVYVNQTNLMVNPFHSKPLKMVYSGHNSTNDSDLNHQNQQIMSESPITDSCSDR